MNEYTQEYQRPTHTLNVYWDVEDRLVLLTPAATLEHDTGMFLADTPFLAHSIDSDSAETRDMQLARCRLRWPHITMTVTHPEPVKTHNVSPTKKPAR